MTLKSILFCFNFIKAISNHQKLETCNLVWYRGTEIRGSWDDDWVVIKEFDE